MDQNSFRKYAAIKGICHEIAKKPFDVDQFRQLKEIIHNAPNSFVRAAQKPLLACFMPHIANIGKNKVRISSEEKQILVESMQELFEKLSIENINVFFNFYTFLLLELYDYDQHTVLSVSEEYKLAILNCITTIIKNVDFEIVEDLYVKENIPKFSQIIYVCSQFAKHEKARTIRIAAMNCIMALARVSDESDITDLSLRSKCADVFMFYLPGLASALPQIALEDVKVGHAVPMMAIKTYGRIISLVMQQFDPFIQELDLNDFLSQVSVSGVTLKCKLKDKEDIDRYIDKTVRNVHWYKTTDKKLSMTLKKMGSLTFHDHVKVRMEMVDLAEFVIKYCARTMPISVCTLIEHLIILSQDADQEVSRKSNVILNDLSQKISVDYLDSLLESLEEGFYNAISSLPRKFNSIDDAEKEATVNLLIGYTKLFSSHNLNRVLLSPNMLKNLIEGLLHIIELEKSNVSLLEEYTLKDLHTEANLPSPWINFHYFREKSISNRIDLLCTELVKNNCFEVIYDSLFSNSGQRKEAIYLLNSHILGLDVLEEKPMSFLQNILNSYIDDPLNDLKSSLDPELLTLDQIQDNVVQICLLTEGIGKISLVLNDIFQPFLLQTLYIVMEKAGSGHPLIRAAGLLTLKNLTTSCGYKDVPELINSNFDYFSFRVRRKLLKLEDKEGVLNVLSLVLQHSNVDVLLPMKYIIEEVLVLSCDAFKMEYAVAYLKVFKIFIFSLRRWFRIETSNEIIKSRKAKEIEHKPFIVSGIEYSEDYSDLEGKSAEELYKEDIEKKDEEKEDISNQQVDQEYQKPKPPMHVELTSLILKRCQHFLPSKSQTKRLLVLDILENGLEILREWEDELLPVVHQIWSPLVQRFRDDEDPLIMRFSVRLLSVMVRLSKDFIHGRVVREVLPKLKEKLQSFAKLSHLKDKGSAYRYSQSYKLQCELLSCIGPILYNLDVEGKIIQEVIDSIHYYLSDKQPQELQVVTLNFFKMMCAYDSEAVAEKVPTLVHISEEYKKNLKHIKKIIENVDSGAENKKV